MGMMRYRPLGTPTDDPRLGRYISDDWKHVEKYPLRALSTSERPTQVPVVIGVNWYSGFDTPVKRDNAWWISEQLGQIRGGHAVTLVPIGAYESYQWYRWYDQVSEGICVSEAVCRAMGLINRKRYQPRPLYDLAQANDEWPGASPDYEGTSVNAGLWVAKNHGLVPAKRGEQHYLRKNDIDTAARPLVPEEGISAFRWVTDINELDALLGLKGREWAYLSNSWGLAYPRRVRIPLSVLEKLLDEDGEFGVVTDR